MFDHGYWKLGTWRGIPIRLHWTMPVGALFFGRFELVPAFWFAFFVILLLHELGHAGLVRRFGYRVVSIDVTGLGGLCRWNGNPNRLERSIIAWGGVAAQFGLLIGTLVVVGLIGQPTTNLGVQLVSALTWTNGVVMAINLLPFPPLDGAEAWNLLRNVHTRGQLRSAIGRRFRRAAKPKNPPKTAAHSRPRKGNGSSNNVVQLAALFEKLAEDARRAKKDDKHSKN